MIVAFVFFFKQKTAYEMRISDWSSDVCSSDLRVLSEAERAGAKVVLVGDAEQLQAIEAGAAFRALAERHGAAEINEVRRQHEDWQRDATRALATGRTGEAIHAYEQHGMVHAAETREDARAELIDTRTEEQTSELQ